MIKPHGGKLVNRILNEKEKQKILGKKLKRIKVDEETVKDLKNIARGVYSPLEGFLCKRDFESVINDMRLTDGIIWSIPLVLDVDKEEADKVAEGETLFLVDSDNNPIAILELEEKFFYSKEDLAESVFGTLDKAHPGIKEVFSMKEVLLGGKISLIDNTKKIFPNLNLTPEETRAYFKKQGWDTIVAFQTRNPPHRAHEYLQKCSLEIVDGLFINPVIGSKKEGDFKDEIILGTYEELIKNYFPAERVLLVILPMRMRYAGPREAIFHAIIRKNFGCTHFIVGRDHAGVGNYYGTYDAQNIFDQFDQGEIDIKILKLEHAAYCKKCENIASIKTCNHDQEHKVFFSGTKLRELIQNKIKPPKEFMRPEVSEYIINQKEKFV